MSDNADMDTQRSADESLLILGYIESSIWRLASINEPTPIPEKDYLLLKEYGLEDKTNWGLYPLGYSLMGSPDYTAAAIRKIQQSLSPSRFAQEIDYLKNWSPSPISQRWMHPCSNDLMSEPYLQVDIDKRTRNDYKLVIYSDFANYNPDLRRVTIVVEKPHYKMRRPGNYSPLYDGATGKRTDTPGVATGGGTPIWTVYTSSASEFEDSIFKAHSLLSDRERLDLTAALFD